jgi:hypothetical protein
MFFISLGMVSLVHAQQWLPKSKYHSLTGVLNATFFTGDVASGPTNIRPGLGVGYISHWTSNLSTFTSLQYIRLTGDDVSNSNVANPNMTSIYIRNLHFRNDVLELAHQFRWDIFSQYEHFRKRPEYNIYLSGGIGVLYHNPQAKDTSGFWTNLRGLKTEGVSYSPWAVVVPVGIGMRYKWNNFLDIELELSYRVTFTDYLDDVKSEYVDVDQLDNPLSKRLANRTAENVNRYNDQPRELGVLINEFGETIVYTAEGYPYIASQGPGTARGTQFGPDGYILFQIRMCYILQDKSVNCPRYR